MKKSITGVLCLALLWGCMTSSSQKAVDDVYETDIMIGEKQARVLQSAEKVFGDPKQVGTIFENSDYEVEIRRYSFTNVSDFVMYFYNGTFIQAGLMAVDSPEYPALRADYQGITSEKPGPVLGYTIFMDDKEVVLDTIQP